MKAVICREFGPIETLQVQDVPDPTPAKGQVLIDIEAAGVNFPDGLTVRGEYQVKPSLPFIPGSEAAGVVSAVGVGVTSLAVGQRVVAQCVLGGFAQKVVVQADQALKIPDSMDAVTAAGFILVYATALHALQDKARIKTGESLLVLGAGGGVGLAAVEVGKAMGARVIAGASTDNKLKLALAHGAENGINYANTDLRTELKRLASEGLDVIIDPVGGNLTESAVRALRWGGRLLVIGFARGDIPKLPTNLLLLKEAEAIGVFWGQFTQREPIQHIANIDRLMRWFVEGKLKPYVSESFPLNNVREALDTVMGRRAHGKIVLTTGV